MTSVADYQARARARAMQSTRNPPDVTMGDAPSPPENEGNNGSDDEGVGSDTDATQREGRAIDQVTSTTNTARQGDLTVGEVTRLIQRYNLPEGVVSDVQAFQQVFS